MVLPVFATPATLDTYDEWPCNTQGYTLCKGETKGGVLQLRLCRQRTPLTRSGHILGPVCGHTTHRLVTEKNNLSSCAVANMSRPHSVLPQHLPVFGWFKGFSLAQTK